MIQLPVPFLVPGVFCFSVVMWRGTCGVVDCSMGTCGFVGGLSVARLVGLNPVLDYVCPWFSLVRCGALCLDVIISGSQCAVYCPVWNQRFC